MGRGQKKKVALVTGSSGFIGYHMSQKLLSEGWQVIGLDCMSDHYDLKLKYQRESILIQNKNFTSIHKRLEEPNFLLQLFQNEKPEIVIHLAAQAGVRSSIENPRTYFKSNLNGTFELLEAAREYPPKHILLASTSSAYGANEVMPYKEIDKADHPVSFYAATKKSTEIISHSYAHVFDLPITVFRFFTVYGPWGRPDMAYFKFTKAILREENINVYNCGKMKRDFTYIDDLINAVHLLIEVIPVNSNSSSPAPIKNDSLSPVAPFRVVNIGNSKPEALLDFITALETALETKAKISMQPMQQGDVVATWADIGLLIELTGYIPKINIDEGLSRFVSWYREFYKC